MSAPTGFAAMSHESHGLCWCGIGSHCSGGWHCDGECIDEHPDICERCGREPACQTHFGPCPETPDSGSDQ